MKQLWSVEIEQPSGEDIVIVPHYFACNWYQMGSEGRVVNTCTGADCKSYTPSRRGTADAELKPPPPLPPGSWLSAVFNIRNVAFLMMFRVLSTASHLSVLSQGL